MVETFTTSDIPDELPKQGSNIPDSAFDAYQDIFDNPISLSEQEVIDIMTAFPKGGRLEDGEKITATQAIAELVASEFNGRFPGAELMRNYVVVSRNLLPVPVSLTKT